MALSAYLIQYNGPIEERWGHVSRWFGARKEGTEHDRVEGGARGLRDHVIIIGMNPLAGILADALRERGQDFVIVDEMLGELEGLTAETVLGEASYLPVLREAGIEHARVLVSTIEDEELNSLLIYRCRQFGVRSSMHGYDRTILGELRVEGADHLIESTRAEREAVLDALRREGVLGT